MGAKRGSPAGRVLAGLGLLAGGALAYGALIERRAYTIRHHSVPVLPQGALPLRVLHLSDLHLAPWQEDKQAWLRALAALRPDLVVLTGDLLGHRAAVPTVARALAPLAGTPGVFVHGSNDYFGPRFKNPLRYLLPAGSHGGAEGERLDTAALDRVLTDYGWEPLDNRAARLTLRGQAVEAFGTDDAHLDRDRLELLPAALESLREGAETAPVLSLGVTHAPYRRVLDAFTVSGAGLILAGHTHGGQVRIPGVAAAPATNCDIPPRQARGLSHWRAGGRSTWLNVSAGVGTAITAPIRLACRPEVSLLTLVPGR